MALSLLLTTGALLTGCGKDLPQTPFDPAGPVARTQLSVLNLTLWFAIGIGTVVSAILIYIVLRFRSRLDDKSVPTQIHGSFKLEVLWTLIPIIILSVVAVPTVKAAFSTYQPSAAEGETMLVKVIGNQWWFAFEYPDQKVVTANELYIPVNKAIRLELTSNDVIHSFWIPKLAGKTDVIPNRVNKMWIKAEETGLFYGQCVEFCGTAHALMRFRVQVVSQEEFDAWIKTRQAGVQEPTDPVALAGKALFEGKNPAKAACFTCHTIDGTKAQGKVGPNLSNIGARSTLGAGVVENNEQTLKEWVRSPRILKPGVKMVDHPNLTDEELNAIVAYLRGLNK